MNKQLKDLSLNFHKFPEPGKIEINPKKPLNNKEDLTLSYSPGVAYPCLEIASDPFSVYKYTSKGNLVAVISNGTSVLGLGDIGALSSKPVMEGKAVLFKKFSGIDVFDIEINETNPKKLIDIICSLEPTFGGINLEDIKAPECFYIEQKLKEKMNIPVFHDDQHGTAIVSSAAILNSLRLVDKNIEKVKLVVSGAGAASIACMNLLVKLGLKKKNIVVCDSKGVIYQGRDKNMNKIKSFYAVKDTGARSLKDVISGSDLFLGCSREKVLTQEMVKLMAHSPIILALANPEPEILPDLVKSVRKDAIICTGRSDYPNQVNNVLCFPFIFRGALDVCAKTINEEMKIACVKAICDLSFFQSDSENNFQKNSNISKLKKERIIPNIFNNGLITSIAPAVAKAAMDSGVARKPILDFDSYKNSLKKHCRNDSF